MNTRAFRVVWSLFAYGSVAASLAGFVLFFRDNPRATLSLGVCGILSALVGLRSSARTSALVGICLGSWNLAMVSWLYFFFIVID